MDSKAIHDFFQTHMVLPYWLVNAYETGLERISQGSFSRPTSGNFSGGVLPGFILPELSILSVILSLFQRSFLVHSKEFPVISLDSSQICKELPSQSGAALIRTLRLIEDLGGLKWLSPPLGGGTKAKAYPLFQEETWLHDPLKGLCVDLLPTAAGEGVFLGTVFGPREFVKQNLRYIAHGRSLPTQVFDSGAPIIVRRSLWLEMSSLEQALFLRLEKSCSKDSPTGNLSGWQVQGVQDLVNSVRAPSRRSNLLKLVQRLLRKLKDQGYLEAIREPSYLVFGHQEKGLALAWHERESERRKLALNTYCQWSAERHWTHFMKDHFHSWGRCLGAKPEELGMIQDLLRSLPSGMDHSLMLENQPVAIDLRILFAEWALRTRKESLCPLPRVPELNRLANIAEQLWSKEQARAAYEAFAKEFQSPLLLQMLSQEPLATVSSPKSWAYLEEMGSWKMFADSKESEVMNLTSKKPFQHQKSQVSFSEGERRAHVGRKIAQYQSNFPTQYRSLIDAYLNSLDGASKEMILGVQQNLQPQMFESHLRNRLVQFVMEHTSQWPELTNS